MADGYQMSAAMPSTRLTPEEVERASERDQKLYELIRGELREKKVGFVALFVAGRIASALNRCFYPHTGIAACEAMVYCFNGKSDGRKPDVVYIQLARLPNGQIPVG